MQKSTELVHIIEGILFASSHPLTAEGIGKIFSEEEKPALGAIRQAIAQLQDDYKERGIRLVEVASGFRFQVADVISPYIAKTLEDKPARYSRALLETLALIAYRQPITRGEIEDIRGVAVSTNIMKTLDEQDWIRIVGYKDVPGKPGLYATTKTFLDHFGLKSLEGLPPLAELKDFESIMESHLKNENNEEILKGVSLEIQPEESEVENDEIILEKVEEAEEAIAEPPVITAELSDTTP